MHRWYGVLIGLFACTAVTTAAPLPLKPASSELTPTERVQKIHDIHQRLCGEDMSCAMLGKCTGTLTLDDGSVINLTIAVGIVGLDFFIADRVQMAGHPDAQLLIHDDGMGTPKSFIEGIWVNGDKPPIVLFSAAPVVKQLEVAHVYDSLLFYFTTCQPVSSPNTAPSGEEPLQNVPPDSV